MSEVFVWSPNVKGTSAPLFTCKVRKTDPPTDKEK